MNKKKFLALLSAGLLIAFLALVGCSSGDSSSPEPSGSESSEDAQSDASGEYTLVNEGQLTVAASLDFPPFENLEGDQPVGFSVDLMALLCEEMGLERNYLPSTKFDTIVPMIASGGQADVGVSSITINPTREEQVDFTASYCDTNQGLATMKGSGLVSADDLKGKKIGAQSGTTGYEWAAENIADAEIIAFDEMTAVFAALQSGQIDAVAADLPVVQFYVKDAYTDAEVIEEIPTGEQYGIAVSKENPALTAAIDEALKALKDNGKYDELYSRWFG